MEYSNTACQISKVRIIRTLLYISLHNSLHSYSPHIPIFKINKKAEIYSYYIEQVMWNIYYCLLEGSVFSAGPFLSLSSYKGNVHNVEHIKTTFSITIFFDSVNIQWNIFKMYIQSNSVRAQLFIHHQYWSFSKDGSKSQFFFMFRHIFIY